MIRPKYFILQKELISTFNASLVPLNERTREFGPILQAIVEPLLHTFTLSATAGMGGSQGIALFIKVVCGLTFNRI